MPLAKKQMQSLGRLKSLLKNLDQNLEVGKPYDNAINNQLNKT